MAKTHSIPELHRAENEFGVGGLYRPDAEAREAELAGLERSGWYDPAPHFAEELRAGRWVAYGFSRRWGKRVLIPAPWDYREAKYDVLGRMWGHGDYFEEVLFYRLADHETPSKPSAAKKRSAQSGGAKPGTGKGNTKYDDDKIAVARAKAVYRKMSKKSKPRAAEEAIDALMAEGHQVGGSSPKARIERIRKKI